MTPSSIVVGSDVDEKMRDQKEVAEGKETKSGLATPRVDIFATESIGNGDADNFSDQACAPQTPEELRIFEDATNVWCRG